MKKKPEYLARLPVRPPLPLASFGNVTDALGPSLGRDMANERLMILTKGIVFTEKGRRLCCAGDEQIKQSSRDEIFPMRYFAMVASQRAGRQCGVGGAVVGGCGGRRTEKAEQMRLAVYDIETGNPGATVPQYGYRAGRMTESRD